MQFFEKPLSKEIFDESLKFFSLVITKWGTFKLYAKFNENYILMTNIFKLHSYLIYWKCIRQAKSELSIIHSVSEKVCFTINGSSKCYILIVIFFIFPNFKLILSKILWKSTLLYKGFWELLWSCTTSQLFLIDKFLSMQRRAILKFLKFAMKWILENSIRKWYFFHKCLPKALLQ